METPLVVMVLVALLLAEITLQDHFAQECRVYHLVGEKAHETPSIPVKNTLAVSFYTKNESDFPRNIHIVLKGDTKDNKIIHIRDDGEVSLGNLWSSNMPTIRPNCIGNGWITLAILLHDQNIIIYWIDDRENYISSTASLGSNITAKVTTSEPSVYVTLNCPAGCLIHDKNSTVIGQEILLGDGVTIYLSPEEGENKPIFALGFRDYMGKPHQLSVDLSTWNSSLWHKAVIAHDKQNHIIIHGNGHTHGSMKMAEENATIAILKITTALFSLECYPDHAKGLEGWDETNHTGDHHHQNEEDEDDGAGVGEVMAWVLAGMALFLVMVLALLLCTKMNPRRDSMDYAGASVGVIGSFGRQMTYRNAEREAEEDTEPDSPTYLSPAIQHKVPEEEDEHQSNTKML